MKIYTLNACEKVMQKYIDLGGDVETIKEGVLGLGTVVLTAENYKTVVIKEIFLNEWSSGHTVRQYKKTPKKYL